MSSSLLRFECCKSGRPPRRVPGGGKRWECHEAGWRAVLGVWLRRAAARGRDKASGALREPRRRGRDEGYDSLKAALRSHFSATSPAELSPLKLYLLPFCMNRRGAGREGADGGQCKAKCKWEVLLRGHDARCSRKRQHAAGD